MGIPCPAVSSTGSLKIALTAFVTLTVIGILPSVAGASSQQWAHPKAHEWSVHNSRDIQSVLVYARLMLYMDAECNPVLNHPCAPTSRQILQWPTEFLSTGCDPLTAAVSSVRANGPIPAVQAQRWWSTALEDLDKGCAAIVAATAAYNDQTSTGVSSGSDRSIANPAATATSDIAAASLLYPRVERYLDARMSSHP
jgi:hypothetical protein